MTIDNATLAYQNRAVLVPKNTTQGVDSSSNSKSPNKQSIDKSSKLYEQCQEFESIFVKMMLKEMKNSVSKSGLIDGGQAEEIFSDMLYDEYAKNMTKSAGFGLADSVYKELTRNQIENL